jgi:hypothetical protein
MKAIIIAAVVIVAVAITITVRFRSAATAAPGAGMMVKLFLGYVPVLILVWSFTPDDLGFLPRILLAEPRWFDLAACLFFYTTAFAGGLLQLYNLAERGLSLRILAELHAGGGRAMTVDEIADGYSDGKGLAWMYDKRLDGLIQHRLVVVEGGEVRLTSRGWFWAERFAGLRRFLRLAPS